MRTENAFAEDLVAKAVKSGAEEAEVFIRSSRKLSVETKELSLDSLRSSLTFGYSLRIIKAGRLGFSYSTDKTDGESVIGNALASARYSDHDDYLSLPEPSGIADVEIFDRGIDEISEEEAVRRVMGMEQTLYRADKRIRKVRKASASFSSSWTKILSSKGVDAGFPSTICSAQILAVAEDGGDSQVGWDYQGSRFLADLNFNGIAHNAAQRAVCLLGAGKIPGCRADVVLDNSVSVDFLGIFASSLSSEAVQKGKSLLAGALNRKVMSTRVNVSDSGLMPRMIGSGPVDAEGVISKEKIVIGAGVLQTLLYNTYTARKDGVVSTGNAVRGSLSLPSVGVTNLYIDAASRSDVVPKEQIFNSVEKGLYVTDAMGIHTANPISGEFSVGVTGLWIERGELKYPVREAVMSGNVLDFFDKIEAVGDDLRFYGNIGGPSLLIRDVDISG